MPAVNRRGGPVHSLGPREGRRPHHDAESPGAPDGDALEADGTLAGLRTEWLRADDVPELG
ncbi:MAG: hypothetical protein JJE50_05810 [Actinomycetales bacterium]|nr:hypothetical protein [Actinomycetales bacterium]